MAKRSRSYAHLAGVEDSAGGIPVTNGTRANGGRKPRTRTKALSDCISYNVNDPSNVTVFRAISNPRKRRIRPDVTIRDKEPDEVTIRDTRPDVLKLQAIVGNIGNVE